MLFFLVKDLYVMMFIHPFILKNMKQKPEIPSSDRKKSQEMFRVSVMMHLRTSMKEVLSESVLKYAPVIYL